MLNNKLKILYKRYFNLLHESMTGWTSQSKKYLFDINLSPQYFSVKNIIYFASFVFVITFLFVIFIIYPTISLCLLFGVKFILNVITSKPVVFSITFSRFIQDPHREISLSTKWNLNYFPAPFRIITPSLCWNIAGAGFKFSFATWVCGIFKS